MGLQLRVRHALGARVVEVEARGPQRPIVIGRSPQADVQVPMGTVAPSHCVLYIQNDQWVIQDDGSSTGTYVNGTEAAGPVYVNSGDVVRLGESEGAPTIEVDPLGTARGAGAAAGRPALPQEQEPQDYYEEPAANSPMAEPPQEKTAEGADWVGMGVAAGGRVRRPRPVKKKTDYVPIAVGAVIGVVLLTWFIASKLLKEDEPTQVVEDKPRDVRGGGNGGKNIFDFPEGEKGKPKTAPQPSNNDVAVVPPVAAPPVDESSQPVAAVDNDPERQTDEWKAVVEANSATGRPGLALWTIIDYRRLHPGKFEGELKQYEEAAFDRLWWERIRDLCELRDSLAIDIEKKNAEIAQETEAAYKEKLHKEKQVLEFRRRAAMDELTQEMGYAVKEPPNLFDAGQIANLRKQRIAATYEGWKRRIANSLLKTRGLPWERTR